MDRAQARRARAGLSLAIVLGATMVTLGLGVLLKAPCASGSWGDGRQYRRLCYSDIVPLYGTERLAEGRLPYLDRCPTAPGSLCDEYPVLTMYFMRAAASFGKGYGRFFYSNAAMLAICALVAAWALHRMAGQRALLLALAPTLLIYAFVNWDLLAVALATLATLAFLRDQDRTSGILLGLGTAAKLYPALLAIPFALARLRAGRRAEAARLAGWTVGVAVAVNLPFAVFDLHRWSTFFRYNTSRGADFDSVWFVACQRLHGGLACPWSPHLIDALSLVAFAGLAVVAYGARRLRGEDFSRWALAFPLLAAFLLTNKVYSPQYGLWLLPWFALALPNLWLFGLFEAADAAVFITRFTWFGRLQAEQGVPAFAGYHGATLGAFQIALLIRAAVLLACLVAWALRSEDQAERAGAPGASLSLVETKG